MRIEVLKRVFQQNDDAATEIRDLLATHDIVCANLLGGAGCGKTSVLELILPQIADTRRVAVLEGDLATTKDAERIARLNVPVIQLLTEGGCHLNATMVRQALNRLPLSDLDLLVIENVGNPICPANFDLGEHLRISALSVAEGDDKPAKYPLLFKDAHLVLITKCDLLPFVDFSIEAAVRDIKRVNPTADIIRMSRKDCTGMTELALWFSRKIENRAKIRA